MTAGNWERSGEPLPRRRWVSVTGTGNGSGIPVARARAWTALVQAVAGDPAWAAWWQRSGAHGLELRPTYGRRAGAPPRVLADRATVIVEYPFDAASGTGPSGDVPDDAVAGELLAMLEVTAQHLGLPRFPPLPPLLTGNPGDGTAGLTDATDEVIRTMVEVMGVPLDQARDWLRQ